MEAGVIGLKEWAVAIEALRTGKQMIIMRKGGIREETRDFEIQSESFYLYPTYEHQKPELIKPEYADELAHTMTGWSGEAAETNVKVYAELVEDILITSQEQLDKLSGLHIWADRFAEERLKWKRTKPLHLMLLRVYELEEPVSIPILPEYYGCKSWISLPAARLSEVGRKPVLDEQKLAEQADAIKRTLGLY